MVNSNKENSKQEINAESVPKNKYFNKSKNDQREDKGKLLQSAKEHKISKNVKVIVIDTPPRRRPPRHSLSISNALRRQMRSQVWKMSKNTIKKNERWKKLFEDNHINIDRINAKALNRDVINVDALGIENKMLKSTITWLLK